MKRNWYVYLQGLHERADLSTYAAGLAIRVGAPLSAQRHARRANRLARLLTAAYAHHDRAEGHSA